MDWATSRVDADDRFAGPHKGPPGAHPGQVIPNELLPRWRDLPALAWLATRRLSGAIVRVPILGPLARSSGWGITLIALVGARADHAVASHRHRVVLTAQQRWPVRVRWRYWTGGLAAVGPVSLIFATVPLLLVGVGFVVTVTGPAPVGSALMVLGWLAFAAAVVLAAVCAASALRSIAPGERRLARAWARTTGTRLVEATMLAADEHDRRAATILARGLLAHADEHQIAVIARPRNDEVAKMYKALRFTPLPGGDGRILLRTPRSTTATSPWT